MESSRKPIAKIDRISELPDSILSIILSNLPTKNAVGTSILSTRWKNLFLFGFTPKKIDLDDSLLLNPREENSNSVAFINFVDKLFNVTLSNVNYSVEKIILKCDKPYGKEKVASWVSAAVRLNVRNLDTKFSHIESIRAFFHSLSGCTTLDTLKLWAKNELYLPDKFSLPNLTALSLSKVEFLNEDDDAVQKLVQGCPALEDLSLLKCEFWYDLYVEFPQLKTLIIEGGWKEANSSLILETPNLESLMYDGFVASRYYGCDLKCLHTAHINVGPGAALLEYLDDEDVDEDEETLDLYNSINMFVSRCSSTIRLYLSDYAIEALRRSTVPLSLFHNLTWLALGRLQWSVLARLLQIAPNLEHLIIEQGFLENEEGFADFENLLPIGPECLVLRMKTINLWVFEGDEDEIKLVEYFLKNGEVLQKLTLHCLPPNDLTLFTTLLMMPRQSKTCQIECGMKEDFLKFIAASQQANVAAALW